MAYLITDILTFGDSRPSSPEPSDKPLNIMQLFVENDNLKEFYQVNRQEGNEFLVSL